MCTSKVQDLLRDHKDDRRNDTRINPGGKQVAKITDCLLPEILPSKTKVDVKFPSKNHWSPEFL